MDLPRLDVLIYAHDGRGLGHASRSIAIGMALRRLYPQLRVLFVSGCKMSQELIGSAPLDWVKLPSYETEVVDGISRGKKGNSCFEDNELGRLRANQLRQMIELYRPRAVLCDHTPQGKHKELVSSIHNSPDTLWFLGVRGVVGEVKQASSDLARQLFRDHFRALFWYGDRELLGDEHLYSLQQHYGIQPLVCGYVSRCRERMLLQDDGDIDDKDIGLTLSVPWLGENSLHFLEELMELLASYPAIPGGVRIFAESIVTLALGESISRIPDCQFEHPSGERYLDALQRSRKAVIYGGYNSIIDVLSIGIPALVIMREMQDREQQIHLDKLGPKTEHLLLPVSENLRDSQTLQSLFTSFLNSTAVRTSDSAGVDLDGAQAAAMRIAEMLNGQPNI